MKKQSFKMQCLEIGVIEPIEYLSKLYLKGLSTTEISEYLEQKHGIIITGKGISEKIKGLGILRNYRERKLNAIKRGRMIYYKKPESEKQKRGHLDKKTRIIVLKNKKFTCELCGNSPKRGATIEIHHKDFNPLNNNIDNLQVLCYLCHGGLHSIKHI